MRTSGEKKVHDAFGPIAAVACFREIYHARARGLINAARRGSAWKRKLLLLHQLRFGLFKFYRRACASVLASLQRILSLGRRLYVIYTNKEKFFLRFLIFENPDDILVHDERRSCLLISTCVYIYI